MPCLLAEGSLEMMEVHLAPGYCFLHSYSIGHPKPMIFRVRGECLFRAELSFANETGLIMVCAHFNSLRDWCDILPTQG